MEILNMESFLPYFESVRERTLRVLRAVPPEKLEWRHAADVFSCGDLARHIAATERSSRYQGCGPELASGHENVAAFLERTHRETIEMLKDLSPEDLNRKGLSPQGVPVTAWKLLRAMVEHEVHHRGEMYVYLALLGVPRPPLYGATEAELRSYSVA
jgi:uncharacterized damage-inducible protein DinB